MTSIIALSIMAIASTGAAHNQPYQLPGLTLCSQGACPITLDEKGYLVDAVKKNRLFARPIEQTMFNSYSLLGSGKSFVLEMENTSSSRNWAIVVFSYDQNKVRAMRYISLSRSVDSSIKGGNPDTIEWGGKDCRGDAPLDNRSDPFDSASRALCGVNDEDDAVDLPATAIVKASVSKGLVVTIPVYDLSASPHQTATYFFPQAEEPDAGALLCIANCGGTDAELKLAGWLGKSSWINMTLHQGSDGQKYVGDYSYLGKSGTIPLAGELSKKGVKLTEYQPTDIARTGKPVASITGTWDGNAFVGIWSATQSKKSYNIFLVRRIY